MKIGVIGLGVVGGAIASVLALYHDVVGYDKFKPSCDFEEVLDTDLIFIAVPTPLKDGRLDCSAVTQTLKRLGQHGYRGVVVVKSTLSIGSIGEIEESPLNIVVMPEFLRERTRFQDFLRPDVIVVAGKERDVGILMNDVFAWIESDIPVFNVDYLTAVIAKLTMNAFAATKISFANEIARLCIPLGVDPSLVMRILVADRRASPEYADPTKGPFAGKCLPKDLEELINCTDRSHLLKAVREVNELVKRERECSPPS